MVPKDVGHATADTPGWAVMTFGGRRDRLPRVQLHGELQAPPGFDSLVNVGLSINGPVALWASSNAVAELHGRYQSPGRASFPELSQSPNQRWPLWHTRTETSSRQPSCRCARSRWRTRVSTFSPTDRFPSSGSLQLEGIRSGTERIGYRPLRSNPQTRLSGRRHRACSGCGGRHDLGRLLRRGRLPKLGVGRTWS